MKKKPLPTMKRRSLGSESRDWVTTHPLVSERPLGPLVIQPAIAKLSLVHWAQDNSSVIADWFLQHDALLFRGFEIGDTSAFEAFVELTSSGERLEYKDRSTPRSTEGDRIYTSTVYPADLRINLHNEGTYWLTWAQKIYFYADVVAEKGGETPIADVHRVYQVIDPEIREEFERRKVMYVRNYNDGFGLTWQEVYQTDQPAEVEEHCRRNRIEWEWKSDGRLRTRQVRPAVRCHPRSGLPLWFNHGAFFHASALESELRATLLEKLGEDGLPYQTYFGDGESISDGVVEHILEAYRAEKIVFPWQKNDVLLQDNMRYAHAREAYQGQRRVLVAMTEPYTGPEA